MFVEQLDILGTIPKCQSPASHILERLKPCAESHCLLEVVKINKFELADSKPLFILLHLAMADENRAALKAVEADIKALNADILAAKKTLKKQPNDTDAQAELEHYQTTLA